MNQWFKPLQSLMPYIFQISTPYGKGTGFQVLYSKNKIFCGIATAYHVIQHAYEWEENIKIIHYDSGKTLVLRKKDKDRVLFVYPDKDLAFILFNKSHLPVKDGEPKLIGANRVLKRGVETAWCGFPSIAPQNELCFFAGHISCCLESQDSYLVDGIAINGVSGGPAFFVRTKTGNMEICGVISAYIPNRLTGETLPGLCIVRSVEPYQEVLKDLRSLDEAAQKAKEQEEVQKAALDNEEGKTEEVPPQKKKLPKKRKLTEKKDITD